jgi:hypothetical protein
LSVKPECDLIAFQLINIYTILNILLR